MHHLPACCKDQTTLRYLTAMITAAEAHLDVAALYAALDQKRRKLGLSWRQLAKSAGVSPSTLTRMGQGKRPDVDSFAGLISWLEVSAEKFLRSSKEPGRRRRTPEVMSEISALLRADRQLSSASAQALEEIVRAAYERLKA